MQGLIKAAIPRSQSLIFFEHKYLYRRIKEEIPDDDYWFLSEKRGFAREDVISA